MASPHFCIHRYDSGSDSHGEAPSFPGWPLVTPVTAGLVLFACNPCPGEDHRDGVKLTLANRAPRAPLPSGRRRGEAGSPTYMHADFQASSPAQRGSRHKGLRKQPSCLHSNIPSQSTQAGGALRTLANISGGGTLSPLPAFPAVRDESPYPDTGGGVPRRGPSLPIRLSPSPQIPTSTGHHSRQRSFPGGANRPVSHTQAISPLAPSWGHSSSRVSLAQGREPFGSRPHRGHGLGGGWSGGARTSCVSGDGSHH